MSKIRNLSLADRILVMGNMAQREPSIVEMQVYLDSETALDVKKGS
jgi:hypothetical protein